MPAVQTATGTILVQGQDHDKVEGTAAVHARVSCSDQKGGLDGQVARVVAAPDKQGILVAKTVTEAGPGLNGHRPKLIAL